MFGHNKDRYSVLYKAIATVVLCLFIFNDVALAADLIDPSPDKSTLAPPLSTKPPCQVVKAPDGSLDVVTNSDAIEAWDRETVRSVNAGETPGKAFRNRWAFVDLSFIVGQTLLLMQDHKYNDPEELLRTLIAKHIRNRRGNAEETLEGFDIESLSAVREGEDVIGFVLPITRDGIIKYKLFYSLRDGDAAVPMGDGVSVYARIEPVDSRQLSNDEASRFNHEVNNFLAGVISQCSILVYGGLDKGLLRELSEMTEANVPYQDREKDCIKRARHYYAKFSDTMIGRVEEKVRREVPESFIYANNRYSREKLLGALTTCMRVTRLYCGQYIGEEVVSKKEVKLNGILDAYVRSKYRYQKHTAFDFRAGDISIVTDEVALFSVMRNLLRNAVQAEVVGSEHQVTIATRLSEDGRFVYIDVKDQGEGISEENLAKFRAGIKFTTKADGHGIGLTVIKDFVENRLGGTISVESRHISLYPKDHGTTFTIRLPANSSHLNGIAGFVGGEDRFWLRYPSQLVDALRPQSARANDRLVILDLGSATGNITTWTLRQSPNFRLIGLERDPASVKDAIAGAKNEGLPILDVGPESDIVQTMRSADKQAIAYKVSDLSGGIPAKDESVDAVVAHRLRDSLKEPLERDRLGDELKRVLKPGGWVSLVEDLYVEPTDVEGEWYRARYNISARIIPRLVEAGLLPDTYRALLHNPHYHLMLSLRNQDGSRIDETTYSDKEGLLLEKITQGAIKIRGVGVHESKEHVIDSFAQRGFSVHDEWHIVMPESGDRQGHATVMKGILFRKDSKATKTFTIRLPLGRRAVSDPAAPIGVFDSGVGGLSAVRQMRRELPNEGVVYFADTARLPYGSKPKDEVRARTASIAGWLAAKGAKALVIACGSASASLPREVREGLGIPVVDFIDSAAREAVKATRNKKIGVIGTRLTIGSGVYQEAIASLDKGATVTAVGCSDEMAEFAERGELDTPAARAMVERELSGLKGSGMDTLVLGCSHYIFLADIIKNVVGDDVTIISPSQTAVAELRGLLEKESLLATQPARAGPQILASADPVEFSRKASCLLGIECAAAQADPEVDAAIAPGAGRDGTLKRLKALAAAETITEADVLFVRSLLEFFRFKNPSRLTTKTKADFRRGYIKGIILLIEHFDTAVYDEGISPELGKRCTEVAAKLDDGYFAHSMRHALYPHHYLKELDRYLGGNSRELTDLIAEGNSAADKFGVLQESFERYGCWRDPRLSFYMINLTIKLLGELVDFNRKAYEFLKKYDEGRGRLGEAGVVKIEMVGEKVFEAKEWLSTIKQWNEKGLIDAERYASGREIEELLHGWIIKFHMWDVSTKMEFNSTPDAYRAKIPLSRLNLIYLAENLATNAMDARGGNDQLKITVKVFIETVAGRKYVTVSYGDNGTGMPPDVLEMVRRGGGQTTKGAYGSGAGIPAIFKIVNSCGGTIDVQSEVGKGTTFILRLPVVSDSSSGQVLRLPVAQTQPSAAAAATVTAVSAAAPNAPSPVEAPPIGVAALIDIIRNNFGHKVGGNEKAMAEKRVDAIKYAIENNFTWPSIAETLQDSRTKQEMLDRISKGQFHTPDGIWEGYNFIAAVIAASIDRKYPDLNRETWEVIEGCIRCFLYDINPWPYTSDEEQAITYRLARTGFKDPGRLNLPALCHLLYITTHISPFITEEVVAADDGKRGVLGDYAYTDFPGVSFAALNSTLFSPLRRVLEEKKDGIGAEEAALIERTLGEAKEWHDREYRRYEAFYRGDERRKKSVIAVSPESERIHTTKLQDALTYIQAEPQGRPIIVALGTSWIKGYEKGRYLQFDALNPLISNIGNRPQFIVGDDKGLLAGIKAKMLEKGFENARVIVLAGADTVTKEMAELADGKNILLGIDNKYLTADSYVRVMEMLAIAARLALDPSMTPNSPNIPIERRGNFWIFVPKAEPHNYEELRPIYEAQKFA